MTIAAEFAKTRYTLGVPISTLQAISHPLANMAITVQGGRSLARRAAWFLDNEPDERPELAPSAFVFMAEEAAKAATMAVHIQGGLGVSAEAAATAYLVRARGWPLAGGDPGATRSGSPRSWPRARARARRLGQEHETMDFSRVELSDDDKAFRDEARDVPGRPRDRRGHAPRPRDRRQLRRGRAPGHRCRRLSGGGVEAGRRGRIHPGPPPDLGVGEAAGARAMGDVGHHLDGGAVGGEVRHRRNSATKCCPEVFSGHVRLCLGYTEPEGGSDIATCKTRAVRDGDGWVINGSKMFTTGAHNCQYVFLITNTDPGRAKTQEPHHVPGSAGLCRASRSRASAPSTATAPTSSTTATSASTTSTGSARSTAAGRCCASRSTPSTARSRPHADGLQDTSIMMHQAGFMADGGRQRRGAGVARPDPDGRRPIDDGSVAYRLGRSVARMEAALSPRRASSAGWRIAQTMRDISPDLMDILGAASTLPFGTDGAADDGAPSTSTASRRWSASTAARSRCSET